MGITGPLPDRILKRMERKERPKGNAGLTYEELLPKGFAKLERELHGQYMSFLSLEGFEVYHHADPSKKATVMPGLPDFTVGRRCRQDGIYRTLYLEFKIWPNRPQPHQQRVIDWLLSEGATVYVLYDYPSAVRLTKDFFGLT